MQVSGPAVRASSSSRSPFASLPQAALPSAAGVWSGLLASSSRASLPPIESGRLVTQAPANSASSTARLRLPAIPSTSTLPRLQTEKEEPQPQPDLAFGFSNLKPAAVSVTW